ncbi:MAG: hypothetical protein JWL82_174 [Parcubacteria group bacterium]|nr:hypothetical protein [Parcubacteria group bacterium]
MKVVLVTGAAGFIGSNAAEALLKNYPSIRVIGLDNFDPTYPVAFKRSNIGGLKKSAQFSFYEADIRDRTALRRIFKKEQPDAVLHLAAKADTRHAVVAPQEYVDTNITGTLNLLECAKEFQVKRFVFASSSSVYGNDNTAPFKEDAVTDHAISPYGASKKAGEGLAYTYHHNFGLSVVCIRIFNAYGERMRPGLVLYTWVEKILKGETIEISGKGTRRRDYTYIGDLVDALLRVLTKKNIGFLVVNIGNAGSVSLTHMLRTVERATGKKARVVSRPSHHASVERTHASIAKAKRILDWKPKTSFQDGVERFVEWYQSERGS